MKKLLIICLLLTSCAPALNWQKIAHYGDNTPISDSNAESIVNISNKLCIQTNGGKVNIVTIGSNQSAYFAIFACDKDEISENPKADPNYKPGKIILELSMGDGLQVELINFTAFIDLF